MQIPLRAEARSGSEMITQLLFGQSYSILKDEGDWLYIKIDQDAYEGLDQQGQLGS